MRKIRFQLPCGCKKTRNLFEISCSVYRVGRWLFSCDGRGYSVKAELKQCFQQRFRDEVLGFLVGLSADTGSRAYAPPVILQNGVDRFRLSAGRLYDCFIGEKSVIPHASCPSFPRKAALTPFGYGSPQSNGNTRTVCRFHVAESA